MKKKIMTFLQISCFVLAVCLFTGFVSKCAAVYADETEIKLNVTSVSIAKDETFKLRAYNVPSSARIIYRSGNPDIAFVDGRGYITGISNGECRITATVVDKGAPVAVLTCDVLIGPSAISIKLTKNEIVLKIGSKKTIKTIVSPLNTVEKPVFYSYDKEIASVTSIGRVRAKAVGVTTVFAFLKNNQSAECRIYVLSDEDYEKYTETGTLDEIIEDYSPDGEIEDVEDEDEEEKTELTESEEDEIPAEDDTAELLKQKNQTQTK